MIKPQTIITLDAMGGDHAPHEIVHGGVWAAKDFDIAIQLVGIPEAIEAELKNHATTNLNITVIPATEVIAMDENPSSAIKAKKDSSMVVGIHQVKKKTSHAFVTAGNSGGALAGGLFGLGRIKGIKRPALGSIFPAETPHGAVFMLDIGANTEVRPEFLAQFGVMGYHYVKTVLNVAHPRVGILSIGEEEKKGNQLIQEAIPLLKQSNINFIGNVEGKDILAGVADVIVTDGFTGNVYLKSAEGFARYVFSALKREINARPLAKVGGFLAQGAFKALRAQVDYREFGGGPLLGVNGVVIVAHGRSDAYAIRNAIRNAKYAAENNIVTAISEGVTEG